jgi:hypothetical protein
MTTITNENPCRGHLNTLIAVLTFAGLVAVLSIAIPQKSYADTVYAGGSVGSDGTIYGWGVTDVRSMVNHTSQTNATLTSPNGRQANGSVNDGYYTRVDLSLPFDSNDLGNYQVDSYSWAYCNVWNVWFLNGALTQSFFKVGVQQVQFYWDTTHNPAYGCYYANNCPPAPAGSYCGPAYFTTPANKPA